MKNVKSQLDHRVLGERLNLFKFNEMSPGIPFFFPKGVFLYNQLLALIRSYYEKYDYQEIMSPLFMSSELWKQSGHYDYFKQNMFFLENEEFALKPMNCPAHMVLFDSLNPEKRDLPLRIADFGKLFRNENSGSLHGLARVKSFSQDDAHIFLAEEQLEDELKSLIKMVFEIYNFFGFKEIKVYLSGRPEKRAGSDDQWDVAESILSKVLNGVDFIQNPGEGAFYGPKIDFEVADSSGRYFQLGSIQLDFQLLERFNLSYRENNKKKRPIVVHRAILGSLERFIAILLENNQGWLPVEFCQKQVQVILLDKDLDISPYILEFQRLGIRYEINVVANIKEGVKSHYEKKYPFSFIIGEQEVKNESLKIKSKLQEEQISLLDLQDLWRGFIRF
jgi:threonyl-tRNA synthetase